jgi:hypothetical protein
MEDCNNLKEEMKRLATLSMEPKRKFDDLVVFYVLK